jgi:hypothetical protein
MRLIKSLTFVCFVLLPCFVFAESLVVTPEMIESDLAGAIMAIISNWESMGTLVIAVSIVNLGTYLIQKYVTKGAWKRLTVALLGLANSILMMIVQGTEWWKAIIAGLVSSAGAMAVYDAYKGVRKLREG